MIEAVLHDRLDGQEYDPRKTSTVSPQSPAAANAPRLDANPDVLTRSTRPDPDLRPQVSKEICSFVLERVKQLGYKRYKLVVEVSVNPSAPPPPLPLAFPLALAAPTVADDVRLSAPPSRRSPSARRTARPSAWAATASGTQRRTTTRPPSWRRPTSAAAARSSDSTTSECREWWAGKDGNKGKPPGHVQQREDRTAPRSCEGRRRGGGRGERGSALSKEPMARLVSPLLY